MGRRVRRWDIFNIVKLTPEIVGYVKENEYHKAMQPCKY